MIRNPVLPGFFPDPSFLRVGDDYYLASSTFEWFPGVPIHHSRDLVHWRLIGHALTRRSQLDLLGVGDSGGVWAPSISYDDGTFYLVYTTVRTRTGPFKDVRISLTTARDIAGPWSDPIDLGGGGFDPSLFHDPGDGRKWLVNIEWDFRKGRPSRFAGIVVREYDPRARRLVGPFTKVLQKPQLIEGPNLYKVNGWYYLMLAEGGTGWNHGISMARARHVLGPYELDPQHAVLTSRDDPTLPLQKAGHGEIVQTPAAEGAGPAGQGGEWYLAHLCSRPINAPPGANGGGAVPGAGDDRCCTLGRETAIQKVRWSDDGWLRLESGGTAPQLKVPAPRNVKPHAWPLAPSRDGFDAHALDARWSALRTPVDESWLSLTERPGWLRLRGRESPHSLFEQSLLARRLQSVRAVAQTCLEFSPTHFTQSAGLVCWYDSRTFFYLRVTHEESPARRGGDNSGGDNVGGGGRGGDEEAGGSGGGKGREGGAVLGIVLTDDGAYDELLDDQIDVADWPRYFLRAEIDRDRLQFSASPDGACWQPIGPPLGAWKLSDDYKHGLHFTGAMIGLRAEDLRGTRTQADFDFFDLRDAESGDAEFQDSALPDATGET